MNVRVCPDERKILDPKVWAAESLKLAKSNAYNFRGRPIRYVIDRTQKGPKDAPPLPEGYHAVNEEIARQRAALAGARLADILREDLAD